MSSIFVAPKFPVAVRENVPFSELTTMAVGGPARYLAEVDALEPLQQLLECARTSRLPVVLVGGGSNMLVCDAGFDGLVIRLTDQSLEVLGKEDGFAHLKVGAGTVWDSLVERTVLEGWAGIECLSGIPGLVGAAPIQNIGAYGQEVAEVLRAVWVVERGGGEVRRLTREECGFGYRTSHFKTHHRDRFVVTHVEFSLRMGGWGTVRYGDLQRRLALSDENAQVGLGELRQHVLEIRRAKSMVYDSADPNHRSSGSFFMNPVVELTLAEKVRNRAEKATGFNGSMPLFPVNEHQAKLSAAWLIERAGFQRGHVAGRAGLSSNHVLALINRGGARAEDLLALAAQIRSQVFLQFGVLLHPEPELLGFDRPVEDLLQIA